jgi:hypothetical protein
MIHVHKLVYENIWIIEMHSATIKVILVVCYFTAIFTFNIWGSCDSGYWWLLPFWMWRRYLRDGYVFSEEYTATIFMTQHLQSRIKLIIDWAKLVVQTAEFLRDHNDTEHVQLNFLCSHWPCSPSIYFFLWVSWFRCSNGHNVGPIYHRLDVLEITRTAAQPWSQRALSSTGVKAYGNVIFLVNRKGYGKMCHGKFRCHVGAFHCGDWRWVAAKQDGKVIVL